MSGKREGGAGGETRDDTVSLSPLPASPFPLPPSRLRQLNRKQRMEMTTCPISNAAVFLVLPQQPLPRASWVFLVFPGG